MKKLVFLLAAAIMASAANAELIVKIEDLSNGSTTTFADNTTNNAQRNINLSALGTDFALTFSATSYNPFGRTNADATQPLFNYYPWLGINFSVTSTGNPVDLAISVTDTDFILTPGGRQNLTANYGSLSFPTSPNHVEVDYFYNPSNAAFDTSGAQSLSFDTANGFPLNPPPNNVGVLSLVPGPGATDPFSLTQVIKIHVDSGSRVFATTTHAVVPEPGMLLLLAIGAAGLLLGRKRG